jgi:hypothetical protein
MGNFNREAHSLSAASPRGKAARVLPDCEISRVPEVCRTTVVALSDFSALMLEDAQQLGDARPGLGRELETAKAHLDRSLVLARAEPCRSLSDAQAKCLVFQCLIESFPESDCRVNQFARDLVHEVTELLDTEASASSPGETTVHNRP